ncbi:hypothetical protein [Streptomyces sp. WAC05858]|uniref:hypothetical protein n=1 Tax=Streptomyces TaxID=1883 RepID=UPI000F7A4098|nr:hypothetical protein [Streptomyces sp. WAC05858]RSS47281.1 hypothetical protein EF902_10080 [Streptomyces sp. WAC05858]
MSKDQIPLLLRVGADAAPCRGGRHRAGAAAAREGHRPGRALLTGEQAGALRGKGVRLTEKKVSAQTHNRLKAAGDGVFRPYCREGGLKHQMAENVVG